MSGTQWWLAIALEVGDQPTIVDDSITADAVFKRNEQTFLYADAVFTHLAVQGSVTANAVFWKQALASITADALFVHRVRQSVLADATFTKTVEVSTFLADAFFVEPYVKILVADAVFMKNVSSSITGDAVFVAPSTVSDDITGDAVFRAIQEANLPADAVFKALQEGSLLADAVFVVSTGTRTGTVLADAFFVTSGEPNPTPGFRVNDESPPLTGGEPPGRGYWMRRPDPSGRDGYGRTTGAVGRPWIEIYFEFCSEEVFDWYDAWVPTGEASGGIDSIQCWDPLADGGGQWVLFEGDDMYIWRPTVDGHLWGYYQGVRIYITNVN